MADQLRRASQSIPQNFAEGCGRTARADQAKHYAIAGGSAMECAAHLDVMKLDELLESEWYERGVDLLERIVGVDGGEEGLTEGVTLPGSRPRMR